MKGKRVSTGIAGEHFVAGELAKRGWVVAMMAKNTAGVDLLAQDPRTGHSIPIQVKTRTPAYPYAWRLGAKQQVRGQDFWVFVDLGAIDEAPTYFILPCSDVARLVTRHGQLRTVDAERFRSAWHLLETTTGAALKQSKERAA